MINYYEYVLNKKEKLIFIIIFVVASMFLSYIFYHNLYPAIAFTLLYKKAENRGKEYLLQKRRKDLREQFKDLLFNLATAISTKSSMKEAIGLSKYNLIPIYGENSIINSELEYLYSKMKMEDDVTVLKDFARRSSIEDITDFVQIYASCKYTGANLVLAMNKASSVIIDKMTIEKEIEEMIRRKKYEGLVILIMPIIILFLLNISTADYLLVLYTTTVGNIIMTGAILSYVCVYELIERITRIKV